MFEVFARDHFSAAHFIEGHGGQCEKLHGHNWMVELSVERESPDELGMIIDFKILKELLKGVLSRLDHENLNELDEFSETNPTAENIAKFIFGAVQQSVSTSCGDANRVSAVKVTETPGCGAVYRDG